MAGFATYRVQQLRAPCNGPMDELFAAVLGATQDRELALLRVAALARLPATCPDDATDLLLGWFGLDRYPGDTPDTIRARCGAAFSLYELGGSPQSILDALRAFGLVDVRVLTEGYDGPIYRGSWYSRGRVILGPDFGSTGIGPSLLGTHTTLGTWVLGADITVAQRATLKRITWAWKDAYGVAPDILLIYEACALGLHTTLGVGWILGADPQLGDNTHLSTWVLGGVDLT